MTIRSHEIHLWQCDAMGGDAWFKGARVPLTDAELRRAERFVSNADRLRFIRNRAALKCVLSSYLGIEPEEITLTDASGVKPTILNSSTADWLHYSVSHSADLLLIAVANSRVVGVDVELIRPVRHLDKVASRMFTANAVRRIVTQREPVRLREFFKEWTLSEALCKLRGDGIWKRSAHNKAALITAEEYSVFRLDVGSGFAAALVAEGASLRLIQRKV